MKDSCPVLTCSLFYDWHFNTNDTRLAVSTWQQVEQNSETTVGVTTTEQEVKLLSKSPLSVIFN